MKRNEEPDKHDDAPGDDLQRNVHEALKSLGWAVPECEDGVSRAEAQSPAAGPALPEALGDAGAVLDGKGGGLASARPHGFADDAASEENLARAAREGGKIPPEIEERMRRDRKAAEEALEQGDSEP